MNKRKRDYDDSDSEQEDDFISNDGYDSADTEYCADNSSSDPDYSDEDGWSQDSTDDDDLADDLDGLNFTSRSAWKASTKNTRKAPQPSLKKPARKVAKTTRSSRAKKGEGEKRCLRASKGVDYKIPTMDDLPAHVFDACTPSKRSKRRRRDEDGEYTEPTRRGANCMSWLGRGAGSEDEELPPPPYSLHPPQYSSISTRAQTSKERSFEKPVTSKPNQNITNEDPMTKAKPTCSNSYHLTIEEIPKMTSPRTSQEVTTNASSNAGNVVRLAKRTLAIAAEHALDDIHPISDLKSTYNILPHSNTTRLDVTTPSNDQLLTLEIMTSKVKHYLTSRMRKTVRYLDGNERDVAISVTNGGLSLVEFLVVMERMPVSVRAMMLGL